MNKCDKLKITINDSPPSSTPFSNDLLYCLWPGLETCFGQWDNSKYKASRGLGNACARWLALLSFSGTLQLPPGKRAQASLRDDETWPGHPCAVSPSGTELLDVGVRPL